MITVILKIEESLTWIPTMSDVAAMLVSEML